MSMANPSSNNPFRQILRPTSSNTEALLSGAAGAGKNSVLLSYLTNWDTQKVLTVAGVAATVGLGSAALYFRGRCGSADVTEKKRSRVSFKNSPQVSKIDIKNEDIINGNVEAEGAVPPPPKPKTPAAPVAITANKAVTCEPEPAAAPHKPVPKKENKLVLKQCPRGRKTPCIAPFPLKLETFLRVHGIKYELDFNGHEPKLYGSPWIRFNTEDVTDSQNVVQFLIDTYKIKVEKGLSAEQRAMATAYTHLLENHLYWGIALWRWVYDGARSLKEIQLLPKKIQELIPDVCKTVAQAAWFHGIGKMSPAEVKKAVLKDLASLSDFLGDKSYFLDTKVPTELDCTAFGMLAQFLWNMKGPFHDAIINDHKNLRDFCWRMRQTFWPDWEDCLNNKDFFSAEPYPVAESSSFNF